MTPALETNQMTTKLRKRLSWMVYGFMLLFVVCAGAMLQNAQSQYEAAHHDALMWKDVIDHVPTGLVVTDDKGYIIAWNNGAKDLLGWEEQEVADHHIRFLMTDEDLKHAHDHIFDRVDDYDGCLDEEGQIVRSVCWVPTKDGEMREVRVRVLCVKNSHHCFLVHIEPEERLAPLQRQERPDEKTFRLHLQLRK